MERLGTKTVDHAVFPITNTFNKQNTLTAGY